MFEEIEKEGVVIHNSQKNTMTYIPNVISIQPLEDLFSATEWLFLEALNDYNNTNKEIDERRKKYGYCQQNIDDTEKLSIRLGSRTQGYVNQLCLMEDILIYEYDRMCSLIKEASGKKIIFNTQNDYKELKERLDDIRTFRNKVVAHTAYTKPKINRKTGEIEDNPETIVRSILNLFPEPGGITLGTSFFSGFTTQRPQFSPITIFGWEEEIKPIFQDWKKLFIDQLKELSAKCPIVNKQFEIKVRYHKNRIISRVNPEETK